MLDLVAMNALDAEEAERIARAIADENRFITADIISDFCNKLAR